MTDNYFSTTLAHSKSPKVSRRTTFQDELEAAVSCRARKKSDQYSYSDDFDDDGDEDDVLKELLSSRKKRVDAFKAGKSKAKINDFQLSDDEGENERPKKVSFMKTRRVNKSPLQDVVPTSPDNGQTDSTIGDNTTSPSQRPKSSRHDNKESIASENHDWDSPLSSILRKSPSEARLGRTSENSQWDSPFPLPSDGVEVETPLPLSSESSEEKKGSVVGEQKPPSPQPLAGGVTHTSLADSLPENDPPRPKPRSRTVKMSSPRAEERAADAASPDSRAPTSSVSLPLSASDMASNSTTSSSGKLSTTRSHSPQGSQGDHSISSKLTKSSASTRSQQSQALSKSTEDSWSKDGNISEDIKDQGGKYSSSFEEFQEDYVVPLEPTTSRLSHMSEKSDTRPSSSQSKGIRKSRSVSSYTVESKYLGSLKVLDCKLPLKEAQPEASDALRAAIYQEWLKKKQKKLQETMRLKKQEEQLKEEKRKKDEQTKTEDAKASYEAWKENKSEVIKAQIKEKQEATRKKQREIDEQEEKKQSSKKVFEKWKQEHDEILKEKYRKRKEADSKVKQKEEEKKEERKRECKSAVSNWIVLSSPEMIQG
ncbi:microtubule-associated protein 9 isoform X2 [Osmerus eperlanus]|uniref:microtubule-associated protein 9 isoform X2 n=1 Tax=Osmerus eperlanus TaxID=29151 RepID=UPI002E1688CF